MQQAVGLPDGLASMAPGPQLGLLLAGIDLSQVPNDQVADVVCARSRQQSHELAAMMSALVEIAHRVPFVPQGRVARSEQPQPHANEEIATTLTWTPMQALGEHGFAEQIVCRVPLVHAALASGRIDRGKAWVFADYTLGLSDAQIARVCELLLPVAPDLTSGQLRARMRRLVIALDPDAARRRYEKALTEREVVCYLGPEGTATITARGLTPGEVAASAERVDQLASEIRRAGSPQTLPQVRADLVVALLDGSLHHLDDAQIIATMLARVAEPGLDPTPDPDPDPDPDTDTDPDTDADADADADLDLDLDLDPVPDADVDPAGEPAGEVDTSSNHDSGGRPPGEVDSDPDRDPAGDPGGDPAGDPGGAPAGAPAGDPGGDGTGDRPGDGGGVSDHGGAARAGVEVRVRVSTVLGRDDHPGELPGLGPVPADAARAVVAEQYRAEWRFAITDDGGYLLLAGVTRHRPRRDTATDRAGPRPLLGSRGGIVELQIPATFLADLAAEPPTGWGPLIADLAGQYARRQALTDELDRRPRARLPHTALRRHVQVRDRTCVFPGCRRRACRAQQDHTVEHGLGGPTRVANLGPLCVHHHALKSSAGWRLCQPCPGLFVWTSPLGRVHHTRGEPITPPMPDPLPAPPSDDPPVDRVGPARDAGPDEDPLFERPRPLHDHAEDALGSRASPHPAVDTDPPPF